MTGRRIAVVLMNLGGPDGPEAVRPFLYNLFRDPAIITAPALIRYPLAVLISRTREKSAQANYAIMGGGSPLLPETQKQADALSRVLAERLPGDETEVFIAMRYWRPLTDEVARSLSLGDDGLAALALPLLDEPLVLSTRIRSPMLAKIERLSATSRVGLAGCSMQ